MYLVRNVTFMEGGELKYIQEKLTVENCAHHFGILLP